MADLSFSSGGVPFRSVQSGISRADRGAMGRYCQTFARWKKAELFLQRYGHTYPLKDAAGKVRCFIAFPEVNIAATLAQQLGRLEQEFGLTPSARTRLWPESAPPADDETARLRQKFFGIPYPDPPVPALPGRRGTRARPGMAPSGGEGEHR